MSAHATEITFGHAIWVLTKNVGGHAWTLANSRSDWQK